MSWHLHVQSIKASLRKSQFQLSCPSGQYDLDDMLYSNL